MKMKRIENDDEDDPKMQKMKMKINIKSTGEKMKKTKNIEKMKR